MPIDGKHGGPDRFLKEFRDPPVTLFVKGADRNSSSNNRLTSTEITNKQQGGAPRVVPGSTSNGELVLKRTPADESSGTVDI